MRKWTDSDWFWLVLPVAVAFAGAELVYRSLLLFSQDSAHAVKQAEAAFPVVASALHVVLFNLALWRARADGIPLRSLISKSRERPIRDIATSIGIAVMIIIIIIATVNVVMRLTSWQLASTNPLPNWAMIWLFCVTPFTAGIAEETYFRAFLFRRMHHRPPLLVWASTSAAFAMWHVLPSWYLHTFLVGLFLGWVFLRTQRLLPLIVGHVLADAVLIGLEFFGR
ncbi:MAG: CPBP family intramembrane glutamic endopeptidase [Aeoliella sp.]